jgi:hypothetical protein
MLILVRSLHTTSRGSVGFENGNMFTNAFSLVRFSCVLGLFSAPERDLEYAVASLNGQAFAGLLWMDCSGSTVTVY